MISVGSGGEFSGFHIFLLFVWRVMGVGRYQSA
jgi:hypothetical protein